MIGNGRFNLMLPDVRTELLTDRELLEQLCAALDELGADLARCRVLLDEIAPYLPLLERVAHLVDNPAAVFRRRQAKTRGAGG
jgi:hypothetical protein